MLHYTNECKLCYKRIHKEMKLLNRSVITFVIVKSSTRLQEWNAPKEGEIPNKVKVSSSCPKASNKNNRTRILRSSRPKVTDVGENKARGAIILKVTKGTDRIEGAILRTASGMEPGNKYFHIFSLRKKIRWSAHQHWHTKRIIPH